MPLVAGISAAVVASLLLVVAGLLVYKRHRDQLAAQAGARRRPPKFGPSTDYCEVLCPIHVMFLYSVALIYTF